MSSCYPQGFLSLCSTSSCIVDVVQHIFSSYLI
nr:MAG TPA: hypothetical protein [Crassvirales sp.]